MAWPAANVNNQRFAKVLPRVAVNSMLHIVRASGGDASHCFGKQLVPLVTVRLSETLELRDFPPNAHAVSTLIRF